MPGRSPQTASRGLVTTRCVSIGYKSGVSPVCKDPSEATNRVMERRMRSKSKKGPPRSLRMDAPSSASASYTPSSSSYTSSSSSSPACSSANRRREAGASLRRSAQEAAAAASPGLGRQTAAGKKKVASRVTTTRAGVSLKATPKKKREAHPNDAVAFAIAKPSFFSAAKPSMSGLGPSHSGGSANKAMASPRPKLRRPTVSSMTSSASASLSSSSSSSSSALRPKNAASSHSRPYSQKASSSRPQQRHKEQEQVDPLLVHVEECMKEEKTAVRARDLDLGALHGNLRDGTEAERLKRQLQDSARAMDESRSFLAMVQRQWACE